MMYALVETALMRYLVSRQSDLHSNGYRESSRIEKIPMPYYLSRDVLAFLCLIALNISEISFKLVIFNQILNIIKEIK